MEKTSKEILPEEAREQYKNVFQLVHDKLQVSGTYGLITLEALTSAEQENAALKKENEELKRVLKEYTDTNHKIIGSK